MTAGAPSWQWFDGKATSPQLESMRVSVNI
jgi:hypothetical protein